MKQKRIVKNWPTTFRLYSISKKKYFLKYKLKCTLSMNRSTQLLRDSRKLQKLS